MKEILTSEFRSKNNTGQQKFIAFSLNVLYAKDEQGRMGSFGPSIWIKCKLELNQVLNSSGGKLHLTQFSATLGLELPSVSSFSLDSSVC